MSIHVSKRGKKEPEFDTDLFDVVAFLEERGIDYSTAGSKNVSAGWIGTSCIFCGDHSNHLGINLSTNIGSCFKCGIKVNPLKLIQEVDSCSFTRAKQTITQFILKDFSHLVPKVRSNAEKTMFPPGTSDTYLPIHSKYLLSRRYDIQFLERKYDLRYTGPGCNDWRFRVVIPVYLNGEIVTYVARDCTDKAEIKYKNAPIEQSILQAKHSLYGLDEIKEGGNAILVEGILDKWRVGSGCVATFGTQMTQEQVLLLGRKKINCVTMLFDQDANAKAEALAYSISSVVKRVECIFLEEGDPDSLDEDTVWELRREIFQGVKQ